MADITVTNPPPNVVLQAMKNVAARHMDELRDEVLALFDGAEYSTCKRCEQRIIRLNDEDTFVHHDGSRGCRAASFVTGQGWDDSLDRTWMATPE